MEEELVQRALQYYEITEHELDQYIQDAEAAEEWDSSGRATDALDHLVRDWSIDGHHEQGPSFEPILETINDIFKDRANRKEGPVRILIPGSGVGRLAHEIAKLDESNIEVTANEFSSYMNIAYRYMESLEHPDSTSFYPYIDWWSHQPSAAEREHLVKIPDVKINASSILLIEGDFLKVFDDKTAHFDAIVTLFFLDTARNSKFVPSYFLTFGANE